MIILQRELTFPSYHPFISSYTTLSFSLSARRLSLSARRGSNSVEQEAEPMAEGETAAAGGGGGKLEVALVEAPPVGKVVATLASLLERVADRNDAAALPRKASAFHGLAKPAIGVRAYLERIARYAGCSPACFVVAYIYLDRLARRRPSLPVDSLTVHRLLITSVLVAVKFMDDIYYNNAYFAKVGGISTVEMNFLEVDFLFGLRFELNVTPAIFSSYCAILQGDMSLESPVASPRLHWFSLEEEQNCQQTQLAV